MNVRSCDRRKVREVVIFIVVGLLFLLSGPVISASGSDGRINQVPWVNSWGAVAVYCVDASGGHSSYQGGRILVLDSGGKEMLSASEVQINRIGSHPQQTLLIASGPIYRLWRMPGQDGFMLSTIPDAENKTLLGTWTSCTPVGSPADAGSSGGSGACYGSIRLDDKGTATWSTTGIVPGSVMLSGPGSLIGPWPDSGSATLQLCTGTVPRAVLLNARCAGGGRLVRPSDLRVVNTGCLQ